MAVPRRHSDFDVLEPEDVNPRGRASFDELRKAYNLTHHQAGALSSVAFNEFYLGGGEITCSTRRSMVNRCPALFVDVGHPARWIGPSHLGRRVAWALREALQRGKVLRSLGRWMLWVGEPTP